MPKYGFISKEPHLCQPSGTHPCRSRPTCAPAAQLAKAMFEGTQQYRKKLKLPEISARGIAIKEEVRCHRSSSHGSQRSRRSSSQLRHRSSSSRSRPPAQIAAPHAARAAFSQAMQESFFAFVQNKIGNYYFCRFVQDVHHVHGHILLLALSYRPSLRKREIAYEVCDTFVDGISKIYSSADPEILLEAYLEKKKAVELIKKGKSNRQSQKAAKVADARKAVEATLTKLAKGTPPDLLDGMVRACMLLEVLDLDWPEPNSELSPYS